VLILYFENPTFGVIISWSCGVESGWISSLLVMAWRVGSCRVTEHGPMDIVGLSSVFTMTYIFAVAFAPLHT